MDDRMILGQRNVNTDNANKKTWFYKSITFYVRKIISSKLVTLKYVYEYNSKYIYNFNVIYIFRNTYYTILLIIMNSELLWYNMPVCIYIFIFTNILCLKLHMILVLLGSLLIFFVACYKYHYSCE